jgi:ubiquinone/menaquinone biosynthesis C-methylase UbiE
MDFIKEFWENQGRAHQASHYASWGDRFAIELEIETIARYIKPGNRVLDIGCANGFSTFRQYEMIPEARFVGIDFAESMIEQANTIRGEKGLPKDRIGFSVASVLDLPFPDGSFDIAYTTRVLINLPTWEEQMRGLVEALRVVRASGLLVISEGFWEPFCLLNSLRLLFGQEPLVEHDFNRYIKKSKLEHWLRSNNLKFEVDEFSSIYYMGSRVIRELIQKEVPKFGDYSSPINKLFYDMEREYSGGGMSVQQAYVISK